MRELAYIPKDSLVCTFFEEVCTKKDAKNDCVINGNKYLSDLDCLELDLEVS